MLTLRQAKVEETTLDTPEAIAGHVHAEYERRRAAAPFKAGDRVRITSRTGIPPEFLIGDVGTVMMCDPEFQPLTYLLGVNSQGMTINFPVATENLAAAER